MKCKNCGKEFEGKFCPDCGTAADVSQKMISAEKTSGVVKLLQWLTPKRFAKIALLLSMVCFVFPFLTVSCQGREMQTVTGVQLMTGFDAMSEHIDGNQLIIGAFIFAFLGIVHTFLQKKHTLTAVCGLISSGLLLVYRLVIAQNIAEQGYDTSVVKVEYRFAWYAAVVLGIIAALAPVICKRVLKRNAVQCSDKNMGETVAAQAIESAVAESQEISPTSAADTPPTDNAGQTVSVQSQMGQMPKKSKKKWFVIGGIVVVLILIAVIIGATGGNASSASTDTYIETVQNGYLGEFTDITVQELLGSYYEDLLGCTTEWDGGENDDGQQIVQVTYTDETVGDTMIQFKMLDEQVFKVSKFSDPNITIEKASDLPAELNDLYFTAYITKHEKELDSVEKMKALIDQLDQISGSAVLYGAAANYTGDRAQLCTLFGEDALETSVPWMLDAYGYLDMGDYVQQDTADTTAAEPASTADTSSADYIFPSDRQYITEADMAGWNQKTALLARNEIYARHGYVFKTQEIQNYFAAKSWYTPNSSYDGSGLSNVEKANVDTISAYEQKMGWAEQDVAPAKLAQGAVSSYVESQGDYCTGFDYVEPYAENEYLVCAKIGEYEWETEYIVEVNGSNAWVIGRLDGGVFTPV